MELPPGYRGYGINNAIAHPDTEKREKQIVEILSNLGEDADRHERQHALMPFEVPESLREKNERLHDKPLGNRQQLGEESK